MRAITTAPAPDMPLGARQSVVRSNACRLRHLRVAGYRQLALGETARSVRGHPQDSLFRRMSSLFKRKKFPVPWPAGNCVQGTGMAAQLTSERAERDAKRAGI